MIRKYALENGINLYENDLGKPIWVENGKKLYETSTSFLPKRLTKTCNLNKKQITRIEKKHNINNEFEKRYYFAIDENVFYKNI